MLGVGSVDPECESRRASELWRSKLLPTRSSAVRSGSVVSSVLSDTVRGSHVQSATRGTAKDQGATDLQSTLLRPSIRVDQLAVLCCRGIVGRASECVELIEGLRVSDRDAKALSFFCIQLLHATTRTTL